MRSNSNESQNFEGSSDNCFCYQECLIHENDHNASYSPHLANYRNYVLYHSEERIEKKLTKSDVNVNLNRLLFNKKEVEKYFLPMLKAEDDIEEGVEVCAYDDDGNLYSLIFKKWANKYYVLNGEWKIVFENHKLQIDDMIKTWMFRHSKHTKLCLALEFEKIERQS
ncbi:hypothetical protein V8G54_026016 [Vigna mungo]|uniref:TF-B3 domain-containing protein n=1 Tax=Vigna mungo TaxID=3915 RepID=A0AAQ3MZT6_VIGMU